MPTGKQQRARILALLAAIVVLAAVAGLLLSNASRNARTTGGATFVATIFPTPTAPTATPQTVQASSSISATAMPTSAAPTPTPRIVQYTVALNDTLWDIALRFGFPNLDAILGANPGLQPDNIKEGQVLNIPGLDYVPPPRPTIAPVAASSSADADSSARVKADAGGLRLRREPVVADNVMTKLQPLTPLRIIGRSGDDFWLQVVAPNGATGWVMSQYVDLPNAAAAAPAIAVLPIAATSAPAATASQFEHPPYLSDLSPRVAEVFRIGQARGNRANVFALIGDSNTENPKFFRAYDTGGYELGTRYAYLQDTIRFFAGSFDRTSPAARGGFSTGKLLDPGQADPSICAPGETPVDCELRIQRPSVALVMIGTGDQHAWQEYEVRLRRIVQTTIDAGVVPVLITKGDDLEHKDNSAPSGYINSVIRRVALDNQMPLLNFSQVVDSLPARGFIEDGFHYNWPADGRSADLTSDKLIYGFNQRNLTALQALDVLRRSVIAP